MEILRNYVFFVRLETGCVGSEATDVTTLACSDPLLAVEANPVLAELVHEMARDNAESFGEDTEDCGECDACQEGEECTEPVDSDRYYGVATPYDPDQHDCFRAGGGSFMEDLPTMYLDLSTDCYYVQ